MNDLHQLLLVPLHACQLNHLALGLKLLDIASGIKSLRKSLVSSDSVFIYTLTSYLSM
jgi:hypothetical protein